MTSRDPKQPAAAAPELREEDGPELADTLTPLRADDPEPQQVPQLPPSLARRRPPRRGTRPDRVLDASALGPGAPLPAPRALYVSRGPGQGQLVPLADGALVIGRSPSSDLRLAHPSVSRRHAQVERDGERVTVRDLASQNGTWVNGARARGAVELAPGDVVAVGSSLLVVRGPHAPHSAGARPSPLHALVAALGRALARVARALGLGR